MRAAAAFLLFLSVAAPAFGQEMQYDRSGLVQSLLPSVVNIISVVRAGVAPERMEMAAGAPRQPVPSETRRLLGSGFVLDPAGEIVTNYHVIQGASQIFVTFSDGAQAEAKPEAADRLADVAILHVTPPHKLTAITWGDSADVKAGDPVLAIGNPLGVGMSVTGGIVSAVNRNIMATPYDDYIQTDAPINHGNSGGPLFDMKGHVVGINTAIISPTAASAGLGFAIPTTVARFVIAQLHTYGWLNPGFLGVKVQQVTPEVAEALGMGSADGSIVANIIGDNARAAGIRVGDVILDYDNEHPSDDRALLRMVVRTPTGSKARIKLWRDGKTMEVTAVITEWPREIWNRFDAPVQQVKDEEAFPPDLGLSLGGLGAMARVKMDIPPKMPAALITAVAGDTDVALRGLAAGDVLLRVDNHDIASKQDLLAAVADARARKRRYALLLYVPQEDAYPGPKWSAVQISR